MPIGPFSFGPDPILHSPGKDRTAGIQSTLVHPGEQKQPLSPLRQRESPPPQEAGSRFPAASDLASRASAEADL